MEKNKNFQRESSPKARDSGSSRRYLSLLGWLVAGLAILYVLAPQIAGLFLSISRQSNPTGYAKVLSTFVDESVVAALPTYTPLPSHTPRPTYTPFPTATETPTPTNTPTPTPIPPALIIKQMETQAQLVVVKSEITRRDFHVGVNEGLCSHGADFSAHGVIEAGIDFDAIYDDSVSYDAASQSYTLNLPAPEFTSCRIEYIRLIENSFSICNPDFDRARRFAEVQVMADFLDDAQEDGLLEEAQERSSLILGDFVRTLTGKAVHVAFAAQRGRPRIDASCKPTIPSGWRYDSYKNVWRKIGSR